MAATLKSKYGKEIPEKIAAMIEAVHPAFPAKAFLRDVLRGYDALELMPRGAHISNTLKNHLPDDFPLAVDILLQSESKSSWSFVFQLVPIIIDDKPLFIFNRNV